MTREDEFYVLVETMRIYQTAYFKTRDKDVLIKSKQLEKLVDEAIKARHHNAGA